MCVPWLLPTDSSAHLPYRVLCVSCFPCVGDTNTRHSRRSPGACGCVRVFVCSQRRYITIHEIGPALANGLVFHKISMMSGFFIGAVLSLPLQQLLTQAAYWGTLAIHPGVGAALVCVCFVVLDCSVCTPKTTAACATKDDIYLFMLFVRRRRRSTPHLFSHAHTQQHNLGNVGG